MEIFPIFSLVIWHSLREGSDPETGEKSVTEARKNGVGMVAWRLQVDWDIFYKAAIVEYKHSVSQ